MSNRSVSQSAGSALFQWILFNAVGWAIGSTLRRLAFGLVGATMGFAVGRVVEGAVIGVAVGIAQSLVLPRSISRGLWVLASTIAWAAAWFVFDGPLRGNTLSVLRSITRRAAGDRSKKCNAPTRCVALFRAGSVE